MGFLLVSPAWLESFARGADTNLLEHSDRPKTTAFALFSDLWSYQSVTIDQNRDSRSGKYFFGAGTIPLSKSQIANSTPIPVIPRSPLVSPGWTRFSPGELIQIYWSTQTAPRPPQSVCFRTNHIIRALLLNRIMIPVRKNNFRGWNSLPSKSQMPPERARFKKSQKVFFSISQNRQMCV